MLSFVVLVETKVRTPSIYLFFKCGISLKKKCYGIGILFVVLYLVQIS